MDSIIFNGRKTRFKMEGVKRGISFFNIQFSTNDVLTRDDSRWFDVAEIRCEVIENGHTVEDSTAIRNIGYTRGGLMTIYEADFYELIQKRLDGNDDVTVLIKIIRDDGCEYQGFIFNR